MKQISVIRQADHRENGLRMCGENEIHGRAEGSDQKILSGWK